jgi:hypothetical protein
MSHFPHTIAPHIQFNLLLKLFIAMSLYLFFFFVSEFFSALFSSPPPRVEEQYSELSIFNLNKPTGWMLLLLVIKMTMNVFDDGD